MHIFRLVLLTVLAAGIATAQLTMDQKISDFQYLASLYAKNYGPYEWKRDTIKFDLLDLAPWLDKVRATKTDLEFYDVASEYVSRLNDAHDYYAIPSNFVARLNFGVDIYDGRLLIDNINRSRLPASEYPFSMGWELVSIDGVDAQKILDGLLRYQIAANPRSTRRSAAQLLTIRPQQLIASAALLPDSSSVVLRRPDGGLETYRLAWAKSGVPLVNVGRYATPKAAGVKRSDDSDEEQPEQESPVYSKLLQRLNNVLSRDRAILNFGSTVPIFANALPKDFSLRLGATASDPFFSGTFTASGFRIGFLRIPSYAPADTTAALAAFAREMAYFQANTDGLIIDEMRNPGGYVFYANEILSFLMPDKWQSIGFEVRPTSAWIASASSEYEFLKQSGAPDAILAQIKLIRDELIAANAAGLSRTKPIPVDDFTIERDPAMDNRGNLISYTKPLIMLIDEFSASGGDYVPATIQDNQRGVLFGWRTMGAGGTVSGRSAGSYSLGTANLTESLMSRRNPIVTPDYPAAPYVENIGVRPDIQSDYMTTQNLTQGGKPFVDAFVAAMVDQIQKNK
jgi:hypothetical protein